MKAIHAHAAAAAKAELTPFSYQPAPLGPDDVEITISHCGICHSDLHLLDNDWQISSYPLVPGHEIVGLVAAVGAAVRHLEAGQRVGVGWLRGSCQNCDECLTGQDNLCAQGQATCVGHYGGFADRIRVDGRFAFAIPAGLASENAAPLLCGGATVYSPIRRLAAPHMRIGVIGIGGLGHLALQFANAFGCHVTALSSSPDKEGEARSFGAHEFIATGTPDALKKAVGRFDLILSTVFADLDWTGLVQALRPNGRLVLLGAPGTPMRVPAMYLVLGQKSIQGSVIAGRPLIREMLDFAARHGIAARTEVMPMAQVNAGLAHLRAGRARYRVVLAT